MKRLAKLDWLGDAPLCPVKRSSCAFRQRTCTLVFGSPEITLLLLGRRSNRSFGLIGRKAFHAPNADYVDATYRTMLILSSTVSLRKC